MTAFLFGAGISRPAGLPLAREITDFLLKGDGVLRHTNERYLLGQPPSLVPNGTKDFLSRILLLLQILKTEADIYYFGDRRVNYEELYFMANQVLGSLSFEEDNPVAHAFAKHLDSLLKDLLIGDPFTDALTERSFPPQEKIRYCDRVSTLTRLTAECCNYLRDILESAI